MNITELKQELVNIEVSIKAITGEEIDSLTDWMHCVEKRGKVETLLQQRSVLLNKMFAATFGEIEHFKQVNEMLYNLTLQLFNRVKSLSNSCEKIADTAFDDDTEVCGTLSVVVECKSDILTLDNDDYYGSDFLLMNHILYLIYNEKNSSVEWFYARAIDGEEKPMCDFLLSILCSPFFVLPDKEEPLSADNRKLTTDLQKLSIPFIYSYFS